MDFQDKKRLLPLLSGEVEAGCIGERASVRGISCVLDGCCCDSLA